MHRLTYMKHPHRRHTWIRLISEVRGSGVFALGTLVRAITRATQVPVPGTEQACMDLTWTALREKGGLWLQL